MNRSYGLMVSPLLAGVLLLLAGGAYITVCAYATDDVEWVRGGGFEQGYGEFEVYRYPRFIRDNARPPVSRVENGALSGRHSLLLPGLDEGGYRIFLPEYDFVDGAAYRLNFRVRSHAPVWVQAELFYGKERISRQALRLREDDSRAEFQLRTSPDSIGQREDPPNGYRIVLWIKSETDLVIDDISLAGPGRAGAKAGPWIELVPDSLLGIYGIGEVGSMQVASAVDTPLSYRILDVVRDLPLTGSVSRPVGEDGIVDLDTGRRGAFRVEIYAGTGKANNEVIASRRYVVIDRTRAEPATARYGIAMEEHGLKTQIDARIQAAEYYRLAADIGAGSIRIFTLVMPDVVSADGINYDFYQIDEAIELCRRHGFEPLVELGSNVPNRIPGWLRTSESRSDTIDLRKGLASRKLRKRLARTGRKQHLDLSAYERYLQRVFEHLGGRVRYFEIWNEPGHKFLPEDYLKIARLTRKVQQEHAPHAKLVGYSSTKQPGRARQQPSVKRLPGFLDALLSMDRGESIDVLSYHSAHAFKFMEKGQYGKGDETGYADLLRATLGKNSIKRKLPIWDTERGVPWASHRAGTHGPLAESLEVARRLPGIHTAAFASNVERLFWFYMEASTSTISRPSPRSGFFDATLEPMPQVAVYDAMTQLIGDASYVRRVERHDGLQIYVFEKQRDTILMAFNWRRLKSSFNLEFPGPGYQWLDVMGNGVAADDGTVLHTVKKIKVTGWPSYLLFPNTSAAQVHIKLSDH